MAGCQDLAQEERYVKVTADPCLAGVLDLFFVLRGNLPRRLFIDLDDDPVHGQQALVFQPLLRQRLLCPVVHLLWRIY